MPVDYNYNDYSSPEVNLKDIPNELIEDIEQNTLISFFSSNVEWYIRKPDYVLPFSMDGRGNDQISRELDDGRVVDVYSGALILNEKPEESYYLIADYFSVRKLKPAQRANLDDLVEGCGVEYENRDVKIYGCE